MIGSEWLIWRNVADFIIGFMQWGCQELAVQLLFKLLPLLLFVVIGFWLVGGFLEESEEEMAF